VNWPSRGAVFSRSSTHAWNTKLHCCGGFIVTTVYGLARTTADLDVLAIVPSDQQRALARFAGRGSTLHQTHGVYLDVVTVATLPDSYEDRGHGMRPVPLVSSTCISPTHSYRA